MLLGFKFKRLYFKVLKFLLSFSVQRRPNNILYTILFHVTSFLLSGWRDVRTPKNQDLKLKSLN